MVLPDGKLVMAYKNISLDRNTIYDGSKEVSNPMKLDAKANVDVIALRYGLGSGIDMMAVIPYKHMQAKANAGAIEIDHKGLGDIVLMVNKSMANEQQDGYKLSVGAGIKFPTGKSDNKVVKGPLSSAPMAVQLGTDEYEYKVMLGYTKNIKDANFDVNAMYTNRPKAKNNYDFGDEFALNLSYMKPMSNTVNLGIEYSYKYNQATDRADDLSGVAQVLKDSLPMKAFSGESGYITPQIQYVPFGIPKVHLSFGVSYLAHYDVKEAQPLEKKRVVFRLGYLF
ncbi:MAG: transporter [Campylobacterales bacterium]|nr:transporter [Campylobacterales bacterium]